VAGLVVEALLVPGAVAGQNPSASPEPSVTRNLCLTVTGPLVQSIEELTERVQDGTITLDAFVDGDCVQGVPDPSLPPSPDAPLPVEVVETGFSLDDGEIRYAVVVHNPNPRSVRP